MIFNSICDPKFMFEHNAFWVGVHASTWAHITNLKCLCLPNSCDGNGHVQKPLRQPTSWSFFKSQEFRPASPWGSWPP